MPISITPLTALGYNEGSNAFTYSRFAVPLICSHEGHAIFVDGADMLMQADICELDQLFDPSFAIQVVKHPRYSTKHKIKYRGTSMECPNTNYDRKNWASVMIFNCEHPIWRETNKSPMPALHILQLKFIPEEAIGDLPNEWNRIVDEGQPVEGAKILHYTAGIPGFQAYRDTPGAAFWHAERKAMLAV